MKNTYFFLLSILGLHFLSGCDNSTSSTPTGTDQTIKIIEPGAGLLETTDVDVDELYERLGQAKENFYAVPEIEYKFDGVEFKESCPSIEQVYMKRWPPFTTRPEETFNWHLSNRTTGLLTASDSVYRVYKKSDHGDTIKIAHIDTGYHPNHNSTPKNIVGKYATVAKKHQDKTNPAKDINKGYKGVDKYNYGHGTGTLGLLAGPEVPFNGKKYRLGGNPYAKIVVIRGLHGSPVFFKEKKGILEAVRIAIKDSCDVISLSHGGGFNRQKLYDAVRLAYRAGIPVVAAAGNNFRGNENWPLKLKKYLIASRRMVFPARYQECIAVSAATYEHKPYSFAFYPDVYKDSECFLEHMQASYKKKPSESNMIAGYSPNLTWALIDSTNGYRFSGGGTSGSVPQVAAAVSLWLQLNKQRLKRKGYTGPQIVDAAKDALFNSARKEAIGVDDVLFERHYGNGIVNARALIQEVEKAELVPSDSIPLDTSLKDIYVVETLFEKMNTYEDVDIPKNDLIFFNRRLEHYYFTNYDFFELLEAVFIELEDETVDRQQLATNRRVTIDYLKSNEMLSKYEVRMVAQLEAYSLRVAE